MINDVEIIKDAETNVTSDDVKIIKDAEIKVNIDRDAPGIGYSLSNKKDQLIVKELILDASGKPGEDGKKGKDGKKGNDGKNGRNACVDFGFKAEWGWPGGDGSNGEEGGNGGPGGDGGTVEITLQDEDSLDLLDGVIINVDGGKGGNAGIHGKGGKGGIGGRGGMGDSSADGRFYYPPGANSYDGKDGDTPDTPLFPGKDGSKGRCYIYVGSNLFVEAYRLSLNLSDETSLPSVWEIGDKQTLNYTIHNELNTMPAPKGLDLKALPDEDAKLPKFETITSEKTDKLLQSGEDVKLSTSLKLNYPDTVNSDHNHPDEIDLRVCVWNSHFGRAYKKSVTNKKIEFGYPVKFKPSQVLIYAQNHKEFYIPVTVIYDTRFTQVAQGRKFRLTYSNDEFFSEHYNYSKAVHEAQYRTTCDLPESTVCADMKYVFNLHWQCLDGSERVIKKQEVSVRVLAEFNKADSGFAIVVDKSNSSEEINKNVDLIKECTNGKLPAIIDLDEHKEFYQNPASYINTPGTFVVLADSEDKLTAQKLHDLSANEDINFLFAKKLRLTKEEQSQIKKDKFVDVLKYIQENDSQIIIEYKVENYFGDMTLNQFAKIFNEIFPSRSFEFKHEKEYKSIIITQSAVTRHETLNQSDKITPEKLRAVTSITYKVNCILDEVGKDEYTKELIQQLKQELELLSKSKHFSGLLAYVKNERFLHDFKKQLQSLDKVRKVLEDAKKTDKNLKPFIPAFLQLYAELEWQIKKSISCWEWLKSFFAPVVKYTLLNDLRVKNSEIAQILKLDKKDYMPKIKTMISLYSARDYGFCFFRSLSSTDKDSMDIIAKSVACDDKIQGGSQGNRILI